MADQELKIEIRAAFAEALAEFRKLDQAMRSSGQAVNTFNASARSVGQTSNEAAGQIGNMSAQFNDIAVMIAAGQNPLTLAIQQGTQISQAFGNQGAAGALKMVTGGLASMLSAVNLATIGIIAGGAALAQWVIGLVGAGEETESLTEKMDRLTSAVDAFAEATNDAMDAEGLAEQYNIPLARAQELLEVRRQLALLDARRVSDEADAALRTKVGDFGDVDIDDLREATELYATLRQAQEAWEEAGQREDYDAQAQLMERIQLLQQELQAMGDLENRVLELAGNLGEEAAPAAAELALKLKEADEAFDWGHKARALEQAREIILEMVGGYDQLARLAEQGVPFALELYNHIFAAEEAALRMSELDLRTPIQEAAEQAERLARALAEAKRIELTGFDSGTAPLRGDARIDAATRAVADSGIIALIRSVEGTSGDDGFNTSLLNGAFRPEGSDANAVPLTSMTLRDILKLQRQMLQHPDNTYNSSALGVGQFVGTTLGGSYFTGNAEDGGGLIDALDLSLDDYFTPDVQVRMMQELVRRRLAEGRGLQGFYDEWQGLEKQGVSWETIQTALNAEQIAPIDPEVEQNNETAAREAEQEAERAAREAEREAERQARLTEQAREAEARAVEKSQEAYDALLATHDPLIAAQQALAEGMAVLEEAYDRGQISAEERVAGNQMLEREYAERIAQIRLEADTIEGANLRMREAMASSVTDVIGSEFEAMITGAKSAKEAFQDMATGIIQAIGRIIAQRFVERFVEPIVDQLFSIGVGAVTGTPTPTAIPTGTVPTGVGTFGGGRARGGPVNAGTVYLVGEEGPELLVTGTSGMVIPNGKWRSGVMSDPVGALAPRERLSGSGRSDQAANAAGGGGAPRIVINNNRENTEVQTSTRSENGEDIIEIVIERVQGRINQQIAQGGDLDASLQRTYGLRRQGM